MCQPAVTFSPNLADQNFKKNIARFARHDQKVPPSCKPLPEVLASFLLFSRPLLFTSGLCQEEGLGLGSGFSIWGLGFGFRVRV